MTFPLFPNGPGLLGAAAALALGILLGLLYFRSLWWSASHFAQGSRLVTVIALMIIRFALLAGALLLASLHGALPLLLMALGILMARAVVMRQAREKQL